MKIELSFAFGAFEILKTNANCSTATLYMQGISSFYHYIAVPKALIVSNGHVISWQPSLNIVLLFQSIVQHSHRVWNPHEISQAH
jgi:hypothetical protein